jgi:hypothetical protein
MPTIPINPTTITAAIIARLATIKRANGYQNDVQAIFEVPMVQDQIPEGSLPALVVLEGEETWSWDDASVYAARLPYVIGGMVNEPGADIMSPDRVQRIRSLERDVRVALLQDPWFAGTCKNSILGKTARFPDADRGFAMFETDMVVLYHFHKGSL